MRTPSDSFNCGTVVGEFADGRRTLRTPDEKLVIVASRSEQITVE